MKIFKAALPSLMILLLGANLSALYAQTIPTSFSWTSTGPIISAKSDATHNIVAVKDPSTVYYNGQYIVYASTANSAGGWGMEYLHFPNWSQAGAATPYFMDDNPNFSGYHTAPQVFYFAPQNKWYLIFQSPQPQYSTNSDPTQPQNWTAPKNFFASQPANVSNWLDYWIICDSTNAYLFFCDDGGQFYRSSTPIGNFPNGFSDPVIVYSEANAGNLFEADNVYTVEGTGTYLADIECYGGPNGHRFFRALTATSLGGAWTPLGNTENFNTPFLGSSNVTFQSGVTAWTDDFSSGGAVIDGNDQTDPININNLTFLYQGDNPNNGASSYALIPWQLGLVTSNANTPTTPTPCTPTAITPYLQVNAGTWQTANSVTVSAGATVNLGPQPLTGGTWSWTGPNGFTSALREIDGIPLNSGTNSFTATYTNPCGSKSTETFTITVTAPNTSTPTSTFTPTTTRTNTAVPPTSTFTATSTATRTNTLTATPSNTATHTPVPPTATFTAAFTHTNTPMPPTATSTNSPVPPTVTNTPLPPTVTNTPAPPTVTNTPAPPTATGTNTPVPPTATSTNSPVPPTATFTPTRTSTPVPATNTPMPPTLTFTPTLVPPTSTHTPVPPTSTDTPVPTPTSSFTFTPTPSGSGSLTLYLMSAVTTDSTNSPHPQIEVVNTGSGPLSLNNVEVRYWFNCDCTTQTVQTWVDWAGLLPAGTSVTGDVITSAVTTSEGGQTDYVSYKFTGNLVLQPGQMIQVQSRFNKSDWSNMLQDNDWSFAPYTSFTQWAHITGYLNGTLVWGEEPSGTSSALKAASVLAYPNPSTGSGVNLAVNLSGNGTGTTASMSTKAKLVTGSSTETGVDPNAQITLKVYTIDGRLIWSTTVSGASIGSTGNHAVYWNEKDLSGANLANGLYIVAATVKSNGQTSTAFSKLMILK